MSDHIGRPATLASLVALALATRQGVLIGKLDFTKASQPIDLDVAVVAAPFSLAGDAIARRLVGERRAGILGPSCTAPGSCVDFFRAVPDRLLSSFGCRNTWSRSRGTT